MARVIPFEDHALARLRERLGEAQEANEDLIAFARGHSGAVSAIHAAVLAAIEADSVDDLLHVVTQEWPLILGMTPWLLLSWLATKRSGPTATAFRTSSRSCLCVRSSR